MNPNNAFPAIDSIIAAANSEPVRAIIGERVARGERFLRAVPLAPNDCEDTRGKGFLVAFCFIANNQNSHFIAVMKSDGKTIHAIQDPAPSSFLDALEHPDEATARIEESFDSEKIVSLPPTPPTTSPRTNCKTWCGPEGKEKVNDDATGDD